MASFTEVNDLLKAGVDECRIWSCDGFRLVIVASFVLGYYHDLELTFCDVESIRCETYFFAESLEDRGPAGEDGEHRRFEIQSDGKVFEIVARSVEIKIGKVLHPAAAAGKGS
jgi:hypothetical protein